MYGIVGRSSFAPYDGANPTFCGKEIPLAALESCLLNAELVYQGSLIQLNDTPAIPELVATHADREAVESAMRDMDTHPAQNHDAAYRLWTDFP